MPQLFSLVGKALGSILRAPGSNDAPGRTRGSGDSDTWLDGSRRGRGRPAEGYAPASGPSSRQCSSGQSAPLEHLATSISQSNDQLAGAADRGAGGTISTTATASGGRRSSSCGGAAAVPAAGAAANGGGVSDASSIAGSSPPAAPHFFRVSRASLSDATASAAGEALRQASVTTCKSFTRENYNNYVRWVRATRGAMKIAGPRRPRVEATARNPNPTLLLRCEHWLEVTDEQHRYGSNLRTYFDFWVAEMEAAELTPPASPALMSPSPSYGHLVALAQQQQQHLMQQQQQLALAGAIASAAMVAERVSPGMLASSGRLITTQQQQQAELQSHQQSSAASVTASASEQQNRPLPPLPPPLEQKQQQQQPEGQPGPLLAGGHGQATGAGHSPGPGPSRFSTDAAAPRTAASGCPSEAPSSCQPGPDEQLQQPAQLPPQQRNGQLHGHRVHHHYHHLHHHHHHHNHHNHSSHLLAQARGRHEHGVAHQQQQEQQQRHDGDGEDGGGEGRREAARAPTTGDALISQGSRPVDDSQMLLEPQDQGQEEQQEPSQLHQQEEEKDAATGDQRNGQQPHYRAYNHHNRDQQNHQSHGYDLMLYERPGSVHRGTDDGIGSPDVLPGSMSADRSHDGDGGGGGEEPVSPADAMSGAAPARSRSTVRFVCGSCDPPSSLLQRRHLRQPQQQQQQQQQEDGPHQQHLNPQQVQRRRSCGETDAPPARHPAATLPRPSSDAVAISSVAAPHALVTAAAATLAQPLCGSPRRSVLCSPSKRFMMAAMIEMEPEQPEQEQQPLSPPPQQQQEGSQQGAGCSGGGPPQEGVRGHGGSDGPAAAAAAAQVSCGAPVATGDGGVGGGDCGGAPPATPQPRDAGPPALQGGSTLPPPTTPAQNTCGAGVGALLGGNCTALRAAKLLSNRPSVGSGTSFFRWLDNGPGLEVDLAHLGVSRAKLDTERVKYLTPDELLEYELDVDIETGLLRYKRSGKLLHTGFDGRGSLDEHRRPPTPPPPAVPLALLGESAAAWWRGGAAAAVAEPPPPPPSAAPPALPPRGPSMGSARQAFRRVAAMGTVHEGHGGGDGGSACGDAPEQPQILALDAAETATGGQCAGSLRCVAVATAETAAKAGPAGRGGGGAAASLLPDLELRGHSASSLARLERSRDACYSGGKDDELGVGTAAGAAGGGGNASSCNSSSAADSGCNSGSGSGSGDGEGGGSSRPCSSAAADDASGGGGPAAAASVLSMSAGEAGSGDGGGGGGAAPSLAATLGAGSAVEGAGGAAAGPGGYEDMAAAAAVAKAAAAALINPPAVLLFPGVIATASRPAALATHDAAAAGGGAVASPVGGAAGTSTMPRTPVAAMPPGAGGVGYHHEEKVAKWIYVVDPELRLFVHPKVRGRFHHSSFLRGGAVVAAGGLAARHGRLRLLTADSGHYWPREENFRWLCEHLVYVGADLSACELKSKHMPVPAATGRELMERMGVPPPWRLSYHPASSPSGGPPGAGGGGGAGGGRGSGGGADAPPSPLAEHMHLLQLQDAEEEVGAEVEEGEEGSGPELEEGAAPLPPG